MQDRKRVCEIGAEFSALLASVKEEIHNQGMHLQPDFRLLDRQQRHLRQSQARRVPWIYFPTVGESQT